MIINKLREFAAWICAALYSLIAWLYELFMNISRVEILKDGDVEAIYTRITMILAIIMVFYVTFEFVKFVVQPEGLTDKEKGAPKIVTKMIIVVLLIAFVPKIFSIAYDVQNKIFDNQVFSKIILGKQDVKVSSVGRDFSSNMLSMFYYVDENIEWKNEESDKLDCGELSCKQIIALNHSYLKDYGKLPYLEMGLDKKGKVVETKTGETLEEYKITFDALFAIIVGGFVAYMLILYCIDAGVRVAQLAFLQIIAPIPIIGYLTPKKDGIFQKWTKQCLTTYLDLFIRVGIIYFILLLCQMLGNAFTDGTILEHAENVTGTMKTFMYIALVMGLLLFAHKAPKMIAELFPKMGAASGNFGLKAGERVAPEAARAIGMGAGGLNRLVKGGIAKASNTRKRNNEIREKRRAAGKDTSRRAVNQERREAAKNEKYARRQNRQAQRAYNKEQRDTRTERNEVLAAEKQLGKARRGGNQEKITEATQKLEAAEKKQKNKKAELQAQRELEAAKRSGNQTAIREAKDKLTAIQEQNKREGRVGGATRNLEKQSETVSQLEDDRNKKETAVKNAQEKLAEATKNGDQTAIAQAQQELSSAIEARDGGLDIYNQDQIINNSNADIEQKLSQIKQNNQSFEEAENQHTAATTAVNNAQTKLADAKSQGDKEIAAAQAALAEARSKNDQAQEVIAQQAVNQAIVNKNIAISKAQTELNEAQSRATTTQIALDSARNNRDLNNARLENEISNIENTKQIAETARKNAINKRDQQYNRAIQGKEAAQDFLNKKQQELDESNIAVSDTENTIQKNLEDSQAKYARAQSDRAEIQNQRYRSTVGAATTGALAGGWRGASTGIQATKIEDISKKIKEGAKKDRDALAAIEKWLDAGGTTTASRVKSAVQKNVGILTDAQVSDIQTRNYDTQISTNKRLSAIEGAVQTNLDSSKDRSGSKLESGEQKTKLKLAAGQKLTYNDVAGKPKELDGDYYDGTKTTSEIYQAEKNEAQKAREKAQAAQQAAAQAKAEGRPNAIELEQKADELSRKATQKEQELGQIKKALLEYAITSVLSTSATQRRDKSVQPDQVLVDKVENTLQSVEESKRNSDTYNKMLVALQKLDIDKPGKGYLDAYTSGNITNYDQLDTIQSALVTIKGQRDRDTSTLETMQGIWKASSKLDSEKAADSSSGN